RRVRSRGRGPRPDPPGGPCDPWPRRTRYRLVPADPGARTTRGPFTFSSRRAVHPSRRAYARGPTLSYGKKGLADPGAGPSPPAPDDAGRSTNEPTFLRARLRGRQLPPAVGPQAYLGSVRPPGRAVRRFAPGYASRPCGCSSWDVVASAPSCRTRSSTPGT